MRSIAEWIQSKGTEELSKIDFIMFDVGEEAEPLMQEEVLPRICFEIEIDVTRPGDRLYGLVGLVSKVKRWVTMELFRRVGLMNVTMPTKLSQPIQVHGTKPKANPEWLENFAHSDEHLKDLKDFYDKVKTSWRIEGIHYA